jgi:hypothetical protein
VPALPQAAWGFRTRGHSVENYVFQASALSDFLKFYFAADLPPAFFLTLESRFKEILRLAVAVSVVASVNQLIKRCGGLLAHTDVQWTGTRYQLLPSANMKLAARQSTFNIEGAANAVLVQPDLQNCSLEALRWIAHGHLGEQVIRVCAADLAHELALGPDVIAEVETGRRQEKLLFDADRMARWPAAELEPLPNLLHWAV